MSFTTTYKSECGCEFDISVSRDWVGGVVEIDDVCIVAVCDKHCPTKRALDFAEECAYETPCKQCIHPSCKNFANRQSQ